MARWMRRALALTVVLAAGAVGAPFALAATNTPPGLLDSAKSHPNDSFAVIVTTSPSSPVDVAGTIVHDDNGNHFGAVNRGLSIVHGAAATVTGQELVGLAAQPGVLSITPDAPVVRDTTAPVPAQEWQTAAGLTNLAPAANAPTIAVVDSGIGHTDALAGRVVGSVNLASDGAQGTNDQYGHGTLVAGIAAGSSAVYPGAAPTARILSLRVIGKDGSARTSDVIAAADWIYANRATYNIRVANFSLHSSQPSPGITDPLDLAVRRLWLTGTVVVAAAGNDGPERMLYAPASDPFVITVGAVGTNGTPDPTDDTVAPWSSNGYTAEGFAKPELAAPGRMLVGPVPNGSTLVQTFPDRVVAPGWMWMSGTSLAAPVVSGIAARLLALHPDWTPDQVKGALLATATHLDDPAAGAGEVNAAAAAALASPPNGNAALLQFVVDPGTGVPTFDGAAWLSAVASASWASASWASASWASASWASASWASTSWSANALADASWASASWASASWASASWASASWASAFTSS